MLSSLPFSRGSARSGKKAQPTPASKVNSHLESGLPGSWILADGEVFQPPAEVHDATDLRELNDCLLLLTDLFPDVQTEVFREMLLNISRESRIEIVTEHLLRDKGKWVKGRYKTASGEKGSSTEVDPIPREQTFRSVAYRNAVKEALYNEFKGLSHASIKAVLAEHNFSYTQARPVLQQVSAKSWRFYLSKLWTRHPKPDEAATDHPFVSWHVPFGDDGPRIPYLRHTLSHELNAELYNSYVAPLVHKMRSDRFQADLKLASRLNEEEAAQAEALFDCECCYDTVPFERTVACNSGTHFICQHCIRSTMKEAVFGQGWAKTVDIKAGTLRCLASSSEDEGCTLPPDLVYQALLAGNDGVKVWSRFEDQVTIRGLETCGLPLRRCPFCAYAEVREPAVMTVRGVVPLAHRMAKAIDLPSTWLRGITFWVIMQPLLGTYLLLWIAVYLIQICNPLLFAASLERIKLRRTGFRFRCRSPKCSIASCVVCLAKWTDPHVCYETTTSSLRQAVEAATTAVIKRTCPRCNTSFVKSTGCNKLVCPCGYAMCYICRSAIGSEGYAHFCQHFRAYGGRCRECTRCDLYAVENEEVVIRQAAHQAEEEWRRKEGVPRLKGVHDQLPDNLGLVTEGVIRGRKQGPLWSLEDALSSFLELMAA